MNDREIFDLIAEEKKRQGEAINLIASENFVSEEVLLALGSCLTNKYAEGYPGERYYGGMEVVDRVENLCKKRALELFGVLDGYDVNVQALSGTPANLAVLAALVPVGEKVMAMDLKAGGHLSHGYRVSLTGKLWEQVAYGVSAEGVLDYEEIEETALAEKPKVIIAGYSAYPREIDWGRFREIADKCGAYLLCDISHVAGLVAAGVHSSPFPFADVVTTTVHKTLRGPRSALIFSREKISKLVDRMVFPGIQGGPHLNQIAAVAVALREASLDSFKEYGRQVVLNAKAMSEEFISLGWKVVSGGTDNHLMLLDVNETFGVGGDMVSKKLEEKGIVVNKNMVPFDTRKPIDPSGIRIGTAAMTSRGWREDDFVKLAYRIDEIVRG